MNLLYLIILIILNYTKYIQSKHSDATKIQTDTKLDQSEYSMSNLNKRDNKMENDSSTSVDKSIVKGGTKLSAEFYGKTNSQETNLVKTAGMVSEIGTSGLNHGVPNKFATKNLPPNFLEYLNPSNIIRPVSEKISSIAASLTRPYQPNEGLASYFNPHYIWKRISDKGQQLLSNPNIAILGLGQIGAHDYPFPYRFRSNSPDVPNN